MTLPTKQTLLNQYQNEIWYWNKQATKLKDLKPGQLRSIKKILQPDHPFIGYDNHKAHIQEKTWFGKTSTYWLNAIKLIEKSNNHNDFKKSIEELGQIRIQKATQKVDQIINVLTTHILIKQ